MTPPHPPTTAHLKLEQLDETACSHSQSGPEARPAPSPKRMRTRRDEEAKAGSRTPLSRSISPTPTPTPETQSANPMPRRRTLGRLRSPVRRRTRILLFLSLLLTAFVLELATRPSRHALVDLLYLFHFKLLDRAYDERWTSWLWWPVGLCAVSCGLRKEPIVFVRDAQQVALVWETNTCADDENWTLQWRTVDTPRAVDGRAATHDWHAASVSLATVQPATSIADARHVHTAHLANLQSPSTIEYELVLGTHGSIRRSVRHSFPWTYSASEIRPETLHIACFADNQFNVRAFRRILISMATFARRTLPAHYFAPTPGSAATRRPHLVLHAGDVVQDPDNLAQWQTDFFDPLTRSGLPFPLGQETPVLLARGNHDWDSTGQNAYTGDGGSSSDEDEQKERGTYFAYSPHHRMRILVLDSNLPTEAEQLEQERWLARELEKDAWREASLKVAVVHTAPWIEWWDQKAWTEGKESQWSAYVRQRLIPQLSLADCALVLSGHSHAYTRGFVPHALVPELARARDSKTLPRDTLAQLRARPWLHAVSGDDDEDGLHRIREPGLVAVTFGGAGGSLDLDRVEDWHVMDQSLSGRYHFGWMAVSFGGKNGQETGGGTIRALDELEAEQGIKAVVYHARRKERCRPGEERVRDVVEWRAIGLDGETELDRFFLVGEGCV